MRRGNEDGDFAGLGSSVGNLGVCGGEIDLR